MKTFQISVLILLCWSSAQATEDRMDLLPNTPTFGCNLCHQNGGGSPCNLFGSQADGLGYDWSALYDLDPDGDNYPSGLELGDPDGAWQVGDPDPDFSASHPGLADSTPCGNGTLEGPEVCDQDELDGASCESLGHPGGTLACDPQSCQYDESGCGEPSVCGDEVLDDDEQCDGSDLGGASCESLGFESGSLVCDVVTCRYDTGDCQEAPPETCGNGIVDSDEDCEGFDLGGESCQSLGYTGGTLTCARTLCRFDKSACYTIPQDKCGNGVLDHAEECDGTDLDGASCESMGYQSGSLSCDAETCQLIVAGCLGGCGNGLVEAGEECDLGVPEGVTCDSEGYSYGPLSCTDDCLLDYEECGPLEEGDNRQSCACASRAGRHGTILLIGFLLLALRPIRRQRV